MKKAICDFSVLTPKPHSGSKKHLRSRRSAQSLLIIPIRQTHVPSSTCKGSEPYHRERRTSAWQSSCQMPNQEVDEAGSLGRIYAERAGRDMIRIQTLFVPLSFYYSYRQLYTSFLVFEVMKIRLNS